MTLVGQVIDKALRLAGRAEDSSFRQRGIEGIDEAIQWWYQSHPWDSLLEEETFLTTASEYLVLPDRVGQIVRIADTRNQYKIQPGGNDWYEYSSFLGKTTGRAFEWRRVGYWPVISQPQSETYVSVTPSTSEVLSVQVRGLLCDTTASGTGLEFYEDFETISTVDDAAVTGAKLWCRIDEITKTYQTTSQVTIRYPGEDKTVARIPSYELKPKFQRVQFTFIPPAATPLLFEYYRRPDRITAETQSIHPSIDIDSLAWRAAGNIMWMQNERQTALVAWQRGDDIRQSRRKQESTHGERDNAVDPWVGYFGLEGGSEEASF